jgi:hypothetical protein
MHAEHVRSHMPRLLVLCASIVTVVGLSACEGEAEARQRGETDAAVHDAAARDASRDANTSNAVDAPQVDGRIADVTQDAARPASDAAVEGTGFHHTELAGAVLSSPRSAECKPYRLQFADTCNGCASGPLACTCLGSPLARPVPSCQLGHCIVDYDCDVLCRHGTDDWGSNEALPFLHELSTFAGCIDDQTCMTDEDCGGGRCTRSESPSARGVCVDGGETSYCQAPDDCTGGVCLNSGCELAEPRSGCASDLDCPGMHCSKATGVAFGECTTGALGEACDDTNSCTQGLSCFPSRPDDSIYKVAGRCVTAPAGKTCMYDADCGAGFCAGGYCSSGVRGAACIEDTQCTFGVCTNYAIDALAYCTTGELGAWCKEDEDCTKGRCTFKGGQDYFGLCSDAAEGNWCIRDDDCAGRPCIAPESSIDVRCFRLGQVCGIHKEGICGPDQWCVYGRCGG